MTSGSRVALIFVSGLFLTIGVAAQQPAPAAITAADYARAEQFMGYNTAPLVFRTGVRPNWIADDRFWYRVTTPSGQETWLVDPAAKSKTPCTLDPCNAATPPPAPPPTESRSPDGTRAAFIRNWNLWVREVASGRETQLTTDGVENFGYATDNAGWTRSNNPVLLWSPDSKKIATFQQDQRRTGDMYLVDTSVGHPKLEAWKYPLPGDAEVTMIQRVILDVATRRMVRLRMPPDQHRSSLCDDVSCRGGEWSDVQWDANSTTLAFVSTSRDHKDEWLRIADAASGAVRDVLRETVATYYESGTDRSNWRYLRE